MTYILNHLKELATRAHYGTSHSPEKRGETIVREYSEQLSADLAGMPEERINKVETIINPQPI